MGITGITGNMPAGADMYAAKNAENTARESAAQAKRPAAYGMDTFEYTTLDSGELSDRYSHIASQVVDACMSGKYTDQKLGEVEGEVSDEEMEFFKRYREMANNMTPHMPYMNEGQQWAAYAMYMKELDSQLALFCKLLK